MEMYVQAGKGTPPLPLGEADSAPLLLPLSPPSIPGDAPEEATAKVGSVPDGGSPMEVDLGNGPGGRSSRGCVFVPWWQ